MPTHPKTHKGKVRRLAKRPPFECIALLLQGGGALGAYQAGVYEALSEANLEPDWVAGISIGAINSAIIAGNAPEHRVAKLRAFWEGITAGAGWQMPLDLGAAAARGDIMRSLVNQWSAALTIFQGVPGFFKMRNPSPWLQPDGTMEATSYYETGALRSTLETLIDFDRINHPGCRLSIGAVNVRTGNFVYFDTATHTIGPEHVMASGALPPGFPAIEIENEFYWDGGLISNTPLQWVLESGHRQDTLAFQVDLWSAQGEFPSNMGEVAVRQKEILYSSRTRASTDQFRYQQMLRNTVGSLLEKLPPELKTCAEAEMLKPLADGKVYNIAHLIYRAKQYEGDTKDYEFSRRTMEEHWLAGYNDAARTIRHPEVFKRPNKLEGVFIFDLGGQGKL